MGKIDIKKLILCMIALTFISCSSGVDVRFGPPPTPTPITIKLLPKE